VEFYVLLDIFYLDEFVFEEFYDFYLGLIELLGCYDRN